MTQSSTKRVKVLFLCLGNSCRSPMAEAIARHAAADVIEASSAGLIALGFVAGSTIRVLQERGYPADGLRSKMLTRDAVDGADLVVNMSGHPLAELANGRIQAEDWEVGDPFGGDPEAYRKICQEIERRVSQLAERLRSNKGRNQL
ncbi:MAG TPA: low molecular weight phosphatase family protein [Candidatus Limnocylindria bacterium]|nr:low molecular weight phosphatase family protein [Candidatus Limnocylindria bacterium]